MLTQATTTPQAPAAPAPPPATAIQVQVPGATRPITQAEISVIRQQRDEMSRQLNNVQNRREEIVNQIRIAPAGTDVGMREQLRILDERIVRIEQDLELSGRTLRMGQVTVGTTIVPPRGPLQGSDNAERGAMIGFLVAMPILLVYLAARWRRRRNRRDETVNSAEHDSRMERLEQAVDAIAIEVERVGESQRYQAKLLAEANVIPAMGQAQRAAEPIPAREYEGRR